MSLPGLPALGEAGLTCPLLLGLLGPLGLLTGGPLGRLGLVTHDVAGDSAFSRTRLLADSARPRTISDSVPAAPTHLMVRRRLMSTVPCTKSK